MQVTVPVEVIEEKIFFIRGDKVMLDADLAKLYGVETKVLLQAVKRNSDRFPVDFMFQLTNQEVIILRSQTVTSSQYKSFGRSSGSGRCSHLMPNCHASSMIWKKSMIPSSR